MNINCTECQALYRVDPERVPAEGVRVRCARCQGVFLLTRQGAAPAPAPVRVAAPAAAPAAQPVRSFFGAQDPNSRAQRIARALVSDIVAYHRERRDRALASGALRTEFRDEILKSWEEYVAQVGDELAKGTPHFRRALNDILAAGNRVF